jgi:amino-acid N-acetyltransferase
MPIRRARTTDVKKIQKLINSFAQAHKMIPRSLNDLYEKIRDMNVYEDDEGKMLGVCSLHVSWEDLAEIRSLSVIKKAQGQGVGRALMKKALKDAKALGIKKVFVLTYYPQYFQKFGFDEIDKGKLPHKIWADCLQCPKFPECDETAVIKKI